MEQEQFDKIRQDIQKETYNRTKGSFKRAVWYGGRTDGFTGIPNSFIAHFGSGKGVRKALRNAPRAITVNVIGAAAAAPLVLIPPAAVLAAPFVATLVSKLTNGAISLAGIAVEGIVSGVTDACIRGVSYEDAPEKKSVYRKKIYNKIQKEEPKSIDEALRKQIKSQIKDLQKGQGLQIIDRNLVKMKDAKAKIKPAIDNLQLILTGSASLEIQMEAIHNVFRTIAEALYYIEKISKLVQGIQAALTKLQEDGLEKLSTHIIQTQQDLENYIVATVDSLEPNNI